MQQLDELKAAAATPWGTSAIQGLKGYTKAQLISPNANTNLLHPRTVLPTLTASLEPGVHWLASAVYGDPSAITPMGGDSLPVNFWSRPLTSC